MSSTDDEDKRLRSVALKNAGSIQLARMQAEEELRAAKAGLEAKTAELARSLSLMEATLEATDDAILVTDADANVTHFNERFRRMWDVPADVLATRRHWNLLEVTSQQVLASDEFLDRVRKIYDSDDEVVDILQLRDGRVIEWFSKIQYADGAAVGRVWSFRDISVRKRAEELRVRLASIVEWSDDAIISKTLDGIITTWNRGAERIFGYSSAEIVGKPVTTLFPPDRLEEERMILDRLKTGEHVEHYETIRVRKNGELVHVSLTVSPVRDDNGQIVGASKIARDVSRQKRQEEQLKAAEAEREELLQSERAARAAAEHASLLKDEFLATLSHELRTPLNAILGWSQILSMGETTPEDLQQGVETIERNARVQAQLIEDLLDMSRII